MHIEESELDRELRGETMSEYREFEAKVERWEGERWEETQWFARWFGPGETALAAAAAAVRDVPMGYGGHHRSERARESLLRGYVVEAPLGTYRLQNRCPHCGEWHQVFSRIALCRDDLEAGSLIIERTVL